MEYKRNGNTVILRLDPGDEICAAVRNVSENEKITCASVSGIGATDDFTVGVFDLENKQYDNFTFKGNHEITNLCGNISTMNGSEYVHLHITCAGKNGNIVGGHLLSAVISLTAEVFIDIKEGVIDRKRNEDLGINQWIPV